MRKEEFREWLSVKVKKNPAGDCLSRCKSVETALEVDLDVEFNRDKGKDLLSKMQYSIADERAQKAIPAKFYFQDNVNVIPHGKSQISSQ